VTYKRMVGERCPFSTGNRNVNMVVRGVGSYAMTFWGAWAGTGP
jgi:hypothetical protein